MVGAGRTGHLDEPEGSYLEDARPRCENVVGIETVLEAHELVPFLSVLPHPISVVELDRTDGVASPPDGARFFEQSAVASQHAVDERRIVAGDGIGGQDVEQEYP